MDRKSWHTWTEGEKQSLHRAIEDELSPKEAAKMFPHIPYQSVKSKMDKLRASKKRKLPNGAVIENRPDRGKYFVKDCNISATQLIDRLMNSPLSSQSQPPPSLNSVEEAEVDDPEDDPLEMISDNTLYSWYFESTDLGKLVIALRIADGVQYSIRKMDEHHVEISADGTISQKEIQALAAALEVPEQMLKFRFQPWQQKLVIQTDNQISGCATIAAVIGTLKVITFPILTIKEDAVLIV